jgi:hypothetical protein
MDANELTHRFQYHPPLTEEAKTAHESVRALFREAAEKAVELVPPGHELALVHTKIEEAMFWANAGIARHKGSEGGTR